MTDSIPLSEKIGELEEIETKRRGEFEIESWPAQEIWKKSPAFSGAKQRYEKFQFVGGRLETVTLKSRSALDVISR